MAAHAPKFMPMEWIWLVALLVLGFLAFKAVAFILLVLWKVLLWSGLAYWVYRDLNSN